MSKNNKKPLKETFKSYPFQFEELSMDVIETDPNQPRNIFEIQKGGDYARLLKSIRYLGIEEPIKVSGIEPNRYIIIDGHRRFYCAVELGFTTIPCRIYPKMNVGEFEIRRYEMQNNRRNWQPIEKAHAINRIKIGYRQATTEEIADLTGISEKNLSHYVKMRDKRLDYLELMSEYQLKEYQRVGFLRLLPKLQKIKQFYTDDIIKILFRKISDNVLYRATDFTALCKIFPKASLHEEQIEQFLTEPEMSVTELCELTKLSGVSEKSKIL